jgi:hypothetical protein
MIEMKAMHRLIKQILYGGLYLGIIAGIVYALIFRVLSPPSCSDGIRNQGEEGIDCGGPCPSCEIRTLAKIRVLQTVFFIHPQEGTIDLGAELKNPNLSWGVRDFNYAFILRDANGAELSRLSGTSFILPGETRWIIRPGGTKDFPLVRLPAGGKVAKVEIEIAPINVHNWQKLRQFAKEASLVTKNLRYQIVTPPRVGFAELKGEVENRSAFLVDQVEVNAVLRAADNTIVAIGQTMLRTLRPGETRAFTIAWYKPFPGEVTRVEAWSHANFLNDATFVKQFGE